MCVSIELYFSFRWCSILYKQCVWCVHTSVSGCVCARVRVYTIHTYIPIYIYWCVPPIFSSLQNLSRDFFSVVFSFADFSFQSICRDVIYLSISSVFQSHHFQKPKTITSFPFDIYWIFPPIISLNFISSFTFTVNGLLFDGFQYCGADIWFHLWLIKILIEHFTIRYRIMHWLGRTKTN